MTKNIVNSYLDHRIGSAVAVACSMNRIGNAYKQHNSSIAMPSTWEYDLHMKCIGIAYQRHRKVIRRESDLHKNCICSTDNENQFCITNE